MSRLIPGVCACYVMRLSPEDQFGIRFGAHNPKCPVFSATLDPVKNIEDAELRYRYEIELGMHSGQVRP